MNSATVRVSETPQPPAAAAIASREPILHMQNIDKTFSGPVVALKRMDLKVRQGDFVSLLGPSGCGKSTALRMIAGLLRPTSGRIEWLGGASADDIGVVFQEPTLMPWATVEQNVWLPFRLRGQGLNRVRDRIHEALALVGLESFATRYPRELSGGMKMRVSIARALVTNPRLILMDEPFAALDEITRQKLNDDLLALKAQTNATVIFVTHSVFESVFLSDRIVVMAARPGRVISEIEIPQGYPRGIEWRTSPDYARIARQTSDTLQSAIATAGLSVEEVH